MKRRAESLKFPYKWEGNATEMRKRKKGKEESEKKMKRSTDAIEPVLKMLEETRRLRIQKGKGKEGKGDEERRRKTELKNEGGRGGSHISVQKDL